MSGVAHGRKMGATSVSCKQKLSTADRTERTHAQQISRMQKKNSK